MVKHGAKNLIVLSRSANSPKTIPFIVEMEKVGCKVKAVGCDISNESALAKALEECARDMPQIRGVIQGAMVLQVCKQSSRQVIKLQSLTELQDSIVEQMTFEQYNAAVRPKVHGSWNLHQQLNDLDFFVMLSSLSGVVGLASQSNYAAGNTFEDALARHRTSKGLHGASIDIGVVQSVGYVAENQETADRLKKSGYAVLSEDDVLGVIESAITSSPQSQMLMGLNGSNWEVSGMDRDQRFTALSFRQSAQNATGVSKAAAGDIGGLIAAASSFDEAVEVVVKGITQKLMDIFMLPEAEVAASKSLVDYGVDSLVAVEMRNMLALKAGAEISIFDIMQSPSITALSATVASKSSHIGPSLVPS
jgi:aryl carrier-like protein